MSVSLILAAAIASLSPVASSACVDRDARVIHAARPEDRDILGQEGAVGTAIVTVDLEASGMPVRVRVFKSSGNAALDHATVSAAQRTTYRAAVNHCHPVPSQYRFMTNFGGA